MILKSTQVFWVTEIAQPDETHESCILGTTIWYGRLSEYIIHYIKQLGYRSYNKRYPVRQRLLQEVIRYYIPDCLYKIHRILEMVVDLIKMVFEKIDVSGFIGAG